MNLTHTERNTVVPVLRNPVRALTSSDGPELLALCAQDPHANAFLAGRVEQYGADPSRLGGQILGYYQRGELVAACWAGANVVPVQASAEHAEAFVARLRKLNRRAVSIVGPTEPVMAMWQLLQPTWGGARDIRRDQPLMVIHGAAQVVPDSEVRLASMSDIDLIFPAAVSMFTEEVGYSPVSGDHGYSYRQRIAELLGGRRTYASFIGHGDQARVMFKADLGCVSTNSIQIQGVWVAPEFRGKGLSETGMAAVVEYCRRRGLPPLSLYVNAYNVRAVRAYERVGFRTIGRFSTILF